MSLDARLDDVPVPGERPGVDGAGRWPGRWAVPLGAAVLLIGATAFAIASGDRSPPTSSAREAAEETTGSGEGLEGSERGVRPEAEVVEAPSEDAEPSPEERSTEPGTDEGPAADVPEGSRWPLVRTTADDVLVFDDGMEGAVVLDVQTGRASRIDLPQRAGDQPFRLWRVGERLAVGWEDIHLVSLRADGPPSLELPSARFFVPAAEPDRLWLIDHPPGGDPADRAWSLVDVEGEVLVTLPSADIAARALRGIPGGLAVRDEAGHVHLLDLDGALHTDHLADGPLFILDATSDHVVWCEDPCDELQVSGATGDVVATFGDEDVRGFSPDLVWMSDDGGAARRRRDDRPRVGWGRPGAAGVRDRPLLASVPDRDPAR